MNANKSAKTSGACKQQKGSRRMLYKKKKPDYMFRVIHIHKHIHAHRLVYALALFDLILAMR